jgi:hypothetical protein
MLVFYSKHQQLISTHLEIIMAKGQQKTNKEAKKPKKASDTATKPLISSDPVRATVTTTVFPKGKEKNKLK